MPPFIIPSYDFRLEGLLNAHTNSVCLAESLLVSHCSRAALRAKHVSKHLLRIQETEEKQMHEGRGIFHGYFMAFIFLANSSIAIKYIRCIKKKNCEKSYKKVSLTNDISSFGMKVYICPAVKLYPNKISFSKSLLKNSHIWIVLYM